MVSRPLRAYLKIGTRGMARHEIIMVGCSVLMHDVVHDEDWGMKGQDSPPHTLISTAMYGVKYAVGGVLYTVSR